jgi:hypothetical protein
MADEGLAASSEVVCMLRFAITALAKQAFKGFLLL